MATQEQPRWEVKSSTTITGPTADQLWPLMADFGNVYKIFPVDVSFSVEGTAGQPGEIRYAAVKVPSPSDATTTMIVWAREELLTIDPNKFLETYEILENNRGLNNYIGTWQVLPIDDHGCTFEYSVTVDPVDGMTYEDFVLFFNSNREAMVIKIESLFPKQVESS